MRSLFDDYKVDGAPLLTPDQDVEISRADIDSDESGRDESGFMHRIILRERVKTWKFSYAFLDSEDYKYIVALFTGKSTFKFSYKDEDGNSAECVAYCSNDSITYKSARTGQYANLSFTIIEC